MKARNQEEFDQLLQENAKLRRYVLLAKNSIQIANASLDENTELKIRQRKLIREIDRLNRQLFRTKQDWWKYLLAGVILFACVLLILSGVVSIIAGASLFGLGCIEGWISIAFGVTPLLFRIARLISYNASEQKPDAGKKEDHHEQKKEENISEIQMVKMLSKKEKQAVSLPSAAGYFKSAPTPSNIIQEHQEERKWSP